MSKRESELMIAELSQRANARSAPAAGTTASCSVQPATPNGRLNLNTYAYSIKNMTAAPVTVTASVSDASIAGTVLMDWDFVVAAAAAVQGAFTKLNVQGLRGNSITCWMSAPASSVVQKVAMATWEDNMVNG